MSVQQHCRRGRQLVTPSLVAAGLAMSVMSGGTARGVVVYDIPGDGQNTGLPADGEGVEYVGCVSSAAGGTVVAPNVVITASHVAPGPGGKFTFQGVTYIVDYAEPVGNSDLTILHLALSTGSTGAPIYTGVVSDVLQQQDMPVTMTGYGGPKGAVLTNSSTGVAYGWARTGAGPTRSWGNNTVIGIAPNGNNGGYLAMPFIAAPGSCVYTNGDSGGGVFVNVNGTYMLVGVASGTDGYWTYNAMNGQDPNSPPNANVTQSIYNLAAVNQGQADPTKQTYTTIYNETTQQWSWAPVESSPYPMLSYASLIDNDPTYTIKGLNGQTTADYLISRINALQNVATTSTWVTKGTSSIWSTASNWASNVPITTGSTAIFDGTGTQPSVKLDSIKSIGNIQFAGSTAYTLSDFVDNEGKPRNSALYMDNTNSVGNATISSTSNAVQTVAIPVITTAASDLDISVSGTGSLVFSGGINNTAGKTVTFAAGADASLQVTAGIVNNGTMVITAGTLALSAPITGSSKLIVGDTAANHDARLDVSGVPGGFHVATGQTLAGHGTVVGAVAFDAGSRLDPGNSIGRLTFDGSLTLTAGTMLDYDFNASSCDLIALTGDAATISMSGVDVVYLNLASGGENVANGIYQLISYTGTDDISGFVKTFGTIGGSVTDGTIVLGTGWDRFNGDDIFFSIVNENSGVFLQISGIVPEPASLALLGLGAVAMMARRRK
ncbi:MAG: PEP-CTERM sorting domain-containing protein [Phycisphaerales bacterium]|nr:PEP-CTERM sorting domain-containing protein [Phycisphaerales bacterium]